MNLYSYISKNWHGNQHHYVVSSWVMTSKDMWGSCLKWFTNVPP